MSKRIFSLQRNGVDYGVFKSQLINVKIKSPNSLQKLFYAPALDQFWLAIRCNSQHQGLAGPDYDEVLLSLSNDAAYALAAAD